MTSSPSATTVLPKIMPQWPNWSKEREREKEKCGRGVLSKPDRARSPFPLQQFLEMMSLFIKEKKIEKEKCVCASGSTRAKVRGEGGSGRREAREKRHVEMKTQTGEEEKKRNRRVGSGQK